MLTFLEPVPAPLPFYPIITGATYLINDAENIDGAGN
jgi:hypothetical protein